MTHAKRFNSLIRLLNRTDLAAEGPAYSIKLYQEIAMTASAAALADEPTTSILSDSWMAEARFWVRMVGVLAPLEDLRARQAWRSGRESLPWRKRITTKRNPPKEWVASHVEFDRYQAVLDIDVATEDLT